jgi:Tol biopolymer transport system component
MSRLLALAALALSPVAAGPSIVFTRGPVLFVRDGGGIRSLGHYGTNPVWSPDGKRVAFEYNGDVFTVGADGRGRRLLVRNALQPAWSPDGDSIAYASAGRNVDVYVADADGSNPRRLTHGRGVDGMPAWSPDGRRIAYTSQRWCAVRTLPGCSTQIFVMDRAGGRKRRLTSSWFRSIRPRFSPDGRRLVWLRAYVDYYENVIRTVPDSLYVVVVGDVDGPRRRTLTSMRERAWAATFSPDGRRVLFSVERVRPPWHLAVVAVDGGPVRVLTNGDRDDLGADWHK